MNAAAQQAIARARAHPVHAAPARGTVGAHAVEAGRRDGRTMPTALRPARPARTRRTGLVSIVVPAKDEAEAIGRTLQSLPLRTLRAAGFRVETVVVDGRSRDGTREIARRHGARVVIDEGEGKGAAMRQAREMLRGDYVVMLDADGSYAPDAIPRLLSPLAWGEADVVMGDRRVQAGAMKPVHRLGNAMLSLGASVLYGKPCRDVCTGLWGFRADVFHGLPLRSQGFELEAEMFALASRMRLRVEHVPVDYLPRAGTTKLSASRDGLRIGWCLVRSRFGGRPEPESAAARNGHNGHTGQNGHADGNGHNGANGHNGHVGHADGTARVRAFVPVRASVPVRAHRPSRRASRRPSRPTRPAAATAAATTTPGLDPEVEE